jgi:rubredoxin
MKHIKLFVLFFAIVSFTACKNNSEDSEDSDEVSTTTDEDGNEAYPDGTYCADIDYYNPDTGTRSTYTLNVEVESNEVTEIHWPNGGWLDDSHFSPEALDSNGSCSITTYDGKQYDIQITGSECSNTDNTQVSEDEDEVKCPECGGDKSEFDDLCWYCERKAKREKEDIEEHTCKRCGQHDSFMFSTDDLCSDCERADRDKKREEE